MEEYSYRYVYLFPIFDVELLKRMDSFFLININGILMEFQNFQGTGPSLDKKDPFTSLFSSEKYPRRISWNNIDKLYIEHLKLR